MSSLWSGKSEHVQCYFLLSAKCNVVSRRGMSSFQGVSCCRRDDCDSAQQSWAKSGVVLVILKYGTVMTESAAHVLVVGSRHKRFYKASGIEPIG